MTTNTQAKGLRFIAFLRPVEKAGKGNLGTAKDWDVRVDIRRRLKFPEEGSPSQASEQILCSGPKLSNRWLL